jgi:hypothetical protein
VGISSFPKIGAILQIVVMLLLQFSTVAPVLARSLNHRPSVAYCSGDHVKCGCSPERVASRTCCCFQNLHTKTVKPEKLSCCKMSASKKAEIDNSDEDRSATAISSMPCGSDPRFDASAAENIKFLHAVFLSAVHYHSITLHYYPHHSSCLSRFLEPPDHPPKFT